MTAVDTAHRVLDRYTADGPIYLTGLHALVRGILERGRVDRAARRKIVGLVSGYEGSPLAGLDLELARRRALLAELGVRHVPAVNEELAATSVSGTQLARSTGKLTVAGVTGYWYGKAPGLDRATDALRHANLAGTDPHGGAVALVGDDPAAKSSSVPCSSEFALAGLGMPALVPAGPEEVVPLLLHAVEMSRASGLWTALKINAVVADGAATSALPAGWSPPSLDGLHGAYAHRPTAHLLGRTLADLERTFAEVRRPLALEYLRRSGLNRLIGSVPGGRLGIVVAGPAYLVVRQALAALGFAGDADLERAGIRLVKLAAPYPLHQAQLRELVAGLEQVVVVEDGRGFLEPALRSVLYGAALSPPVFGKRGPDGRELLSELGELDPEAVVHALGTCLGHAGVQHRAPARPHTRTSLALAAPKTSRSPFFCSGCPHNSSTVAAPETMVGAGIGCHAMLLLMQGEDRGNIIGITQMGGEGAQWIGMAPFVSTRHFVQNLGDGTFAHSGSLAVRAAVAAGVDITFKLLRNSAVAMTGGQTPVGERDLRGVVKLLRAEGVARIIVTSDDPRAARMAAGHGVDVRHRDQLLAVQEELARTRGVTVLIHEQECAAEKRRRRKRSVDAPAQARPFINERVCEGCGDCGAKSSCLSVEPVATDLGRKTRINQSSCNVDLSCLDGDCPAFLTVTPAPGARRSLRAGLLGPLREPQRLVDRTVTAVRITGVGGTGVVTVSQVLATSAALEGRAVRSLDQTGLAQKGGAVVSDVVIGPVSDGPLRDGPDGGPELRSPKLAAGECDAYLVADALVGSEPRNLAAVSADRTVAVISSSQAPTGAMIIDPGVTYPDDAAASIAAAAAQVRYLDPAAESAKHFGSEQYANVVLLGAAYQSGVLPVRAESIEAALSLNGVAVEDNVEAFRLGRSLGDADPGGVAECPAPDLVAARAEDLTAYQSAAYARRYRSAVERVARAEAGLTGSRDLSGAVAEHLYRLMAYKDEYEVARLSIDPALDLAVAAEFGPGAGYRYRLHPPALRALGLTHKIALGRWSRPVFRLLVAARRLRGTPLDPFGLARVRRVERELVGEYERLIDDLLAALTADNYEVAVRIARLPELVRGYEDIKLANVARYRERVAELWLELCSYGSVTQATKGRICQ
jgi:indolepyruvate ferredoxin oxidoreductase